jgi:hypothetical protein
MVSSNVAHSILISTLLQRNHLQLNEKLWNTDYKLSFEIYDVLGSNPKQTRCRRPILDMFSIFQLSFFKL